MAKTAKVAQPYPPAAYVSPVNLSWQDVMSMCWKWMRRVIQVLMMSEISSKALIIDLEEEGGGKALARGKAEEGVGGRGGGKVAPAPASPGE